MAYEKQNFKDGNVLTAAQLNHMEDGIVANEMAIANFAGSGDNAEGVNQLSIHNEDTLDHDKFIELTKNATPFVYIYNGVGPDGYGTIASSRIVVYKLTTDYGYCGDGYTYWILTDMGSVDGIYPRCQITENEYNEIVEAWREKGWI